VVSVTGGFPMVSMLHLATDTDNCQSLAHPAIKSRAACNFTVLGVKFRMTNKSDDGTDCFEIKAKITKRKKYISPSKNV